MNKVQMTGAMALEYQKIGISKLLGFALEFYRDKGNLKAFENWKKGGSENAKCNSDLTSNTGTSEVFD